MSRIDMYAKASPSTLETPENNSHDQLKTSVEILKLQQGHKVFSPAEMLATFTQMRDNDALESPAVEHPEYRGQPWLDVEPNTPYSLRPRIPPPTPPKDQRSLHENINQQQQQPAAALGSRDFVASRIDSQSSLFQERAYSPARSSLAPAIGNNVQMHGLGGRILTGSPAPGQAVAGAYPGQQPMFLGGGGSGWGTPPGLQRLVAPDSIQWVYTDPNGMHQGPFTGHAMNQWYLGGWLKDDLYVKRMQDSEFTPIGSIKQKLNTENIFTVQTSQEAWDAAFGIAPQQPQPPSIPAMAPTVQSRSSTPFGWASGGTSNLAQSMWGSQSHLHTPTRSLTPASQVAAKSAVVQQDLQVEDKEFSGLLQELNIQSDEEPLPAATTPQPIRPIAAPASASASTPASTTSAAPAAPASIVPETPAAQPSKPAAPIVAPSPKPAPVEQPAAPAPIAPATPTPAPAVSTPVDPAPEPRKEPEAAPWAAKRVAAKQAVDLAKVQAQEAAKRKEEQARQRALAQKQAAQQASQGVSTPEIMRTTLGTGGAWGTPPAATAPKRSVADIQREQALAQKAKAAAAPKPLTAWNTPNYGEEISRPSSSFAPTPKATPVAAPAVAPSAAPSSPWQTVSRKAKPTTPASTAVPAASAPAPAPVAAKAPQQQMKPASRTDELIQWAKNTFKQALAKDVNPDELLSLFLTLPNNADAKEFIIESIYSYSTTLDGRRFASEFMQRRKEADATLKPNETWADILNQNNPTADTDPTFKVVTRKRYRQIAKPTI